MENIFEPPMQSKQTALNGNAHCHKWFSARQQLIITFIFIVTKATSKDQQRTLTDPRDAADGVETTESKYISNHTNS